MKRVRSQKQKHSALTHIESHSELANERIHMGSN